MGIFDGDFTTEDAAVLGGTIGFAEESIREEEAGEETTEEISSEEASEIESNAAGEADLRLIRNGNPELFRYIVSIARKQAIKWAQDKRDREAVADELEAMARSEQELKDLGLEEYDDS
jgi:uncharacterized protein YjiS (DUF1127 family)